ncbi:MAG: hypothetical protein H8E78_03430 [Proteobacteria bacterium]|nr:hypothetical protein [Pseudomonadota bacterium]
MPSIAIDQLEGLHDWRYPPDLYTLLGEDDFDDGIHPNEIGHARIAAALLPMLGK